MNNPFKPESSGKSFEALLQGVVETRGEYTVVIDADAFKYSAAHVGDKKSISVMHPTWKEPELFKTRTEFWGGFRKPDKYGGWLEGYNTGRKLEGEEPHQKAEFEVTDILVPEPVANVLHTAKKNIVGVLNEFGTRKYKAYLGKGDSFRVDIARMQKYKGKRPPIKPTHLDAVTEYLHKTLDAPFITYLEADDKCVMEAFGKDDHVVLGEDKDYYGCPILFYNINRPEEGVVNGNQFGKLWRDSKGKVRGIGRMFLYHQVCSEDSVDCYKAHQQSDVPWGPVKAYEALEGCQNDREAFEKMVEIFKHLYPEPVSFPWWKDEDQTVTMTWLDCLEECWQMARMVRFEGDQVYVKDVLDKMGIDYE